MTPTPGTIPSFSRIRQDYERRILFTKVENVSNDKRISLYQMLKNRYLGRMENDFVQHWTDGYLLKAF